MPTLRVGFFVSKEGATMAFDNQYLSQILQKVRDKKPVIHAITNWVTANDVANSLHAIGARPIMAIAQEEIENITSKADALVLNFGTPTPTRLEVMLIAGQRANREGHPVILDPVGAGASPFRIDSLKKILSSLKIAAIRGNRSEIGALAGRKSYLAGVDSVASADDLEQACRDLSQKTGAVVVASGPEDLIFSPEKKAVVENGHPMMGQVTGMGCMLSAVIGAFHAAEEDPLLATISAVAFFGFAGQQAGRFAKGPGTFRQTFFDALYSLTSEQLRDGLKIRS